MVAKLLAPNRTPDSYWAGGAAIHLLQNSKSYSNDLDYFNDSDERVASAFADDQRALLAAGHSVRLVLQQAAFIRGEMSGKEEATNVEWGHDSAWRFLPVSKTPDADCVLNPINVALNKSVVFC